MKNIELQKKLSPLNIGSLALGCIIGWGAFVMPGNTFLPKAGPLGTTIAMGIAAVIMIIIAFNYNYMINKYPVAGGEFTYTQKLFGEKNAFVCSWMLGLSYLAIVPLNATALALIGRNLMNNIFQFGFHYNVAGYDVYMGEIFLAVAALLFFAYLCIKDVKVAGVLQTGLVFALVGGVLVVTVAALINPEAKLENLQPLYNPGANGRFGILAVVAVAPWAFVGFDTIPQAAEEFKFSTKKTSIIMVAAILFGALTYIVLNLVTVSVIPKGYADWSEYIGDLGNLSGLESLPTFYAGKQLMGTAGLVFLGVAVLGAILSGIVGFYVATSRLLYSMAKENVLPGWFGKLDEKYKTPKNAILFVMIISLVAPFMGRTVLGWIVDMSSLGAAIGYGYTSGAAFKFALKEKKISIMITGILGVLLSMVFIVLLLVPIDMFNCSLGKESYICLMLWILMGVIFYFCSKRIKKSSSPVD